MEHTLDDALGILSAIPYSKFFKMAEEKHNTTAQGLCYEIRNYAASSCAKYVEMMKESPTTLATFAFTYCIMTTTRRVRDLEPAIRLDKEVAKVYFAHYQRLGAKRRKERLEEK